MAGFAFLEEAPEFGRRQAAADFFLQGSAAGRGVDDALNMHGADITADAGHADGQEIHDKTRIDAGADDARAGFFANLVEQRRESRLAKLRE